MPVVYIIWALLLLAAAPAAAQQPVSPAAPTGYAIFLKGTPIGREEVTVSRDASGALTIVSQGRLGSPFNLITRRAETRYGAGGSPQLLTVDAQQNGTDFKYRTTFSGGVATTDGAFTRTDPVSAQTLVMPNLLFGGFAAFGPRLAGTEAGAELRVYVALQGEIGVRVAGITTQRIETSSATFDVRRYELVFANPGADLTLNVSVDDRGDFVSINVPRQGIDVVRDDVSSPVARTLTYSNPGDESVTVPAAGFNLGATLTRPRSATAPVPAVILLAGSGVGDRDGMALGVPTLGQLAGAIAHAGFAAVRYDKRGFGQSGGRGESATLSDYAEDARAVFTWLRNRKDIDGNRIVLLGHGEGAWVAMLLASRERRIAGVVALAAPGTTGAELVLEQQRYVLEQSNAADRAEKIAAQERINAAVTSGKGWEGIPEAVRKRADTPWFQSLLTFDPARILEDVRQPLLLLHGELDRQIPVEHVERLAATARKEGRSKSVELVRVRGVNHLLVPAETGHVSEYVTLKDRTVSSDVSAAITGWLTRTFSGNDGSR